MASLIRRIFGARAVTPTLDAVRFDATGYDFMGEQRPGHLRVWNTPEGDQVGLLFFNVPPDLPAGASSVRELRDYYQCMIADSTPSGAGKLVDTNVVAAGGCLAIRTIVSVPQEPSGRAVVGSLTIPFRDFSFVLKSQALEAGLTGVKESVLLARRWATESTAQPLPGDPTWDPDAPEHDVEFPHHPVARTRRVLDHLQAGLRVDEEVRRLPGFALPR